MRLVILLVPLFPVLGCQVHTADPRNFSDATLPGFHFVPWPFDWMNDPNGPVYDPTTGLYHLFYQYKTPREWGHAVSSDLVNWVQLQEALTRQAWYDEGGDYSGSATVLCDEQRTMMLTVSSSTEYMFLMVPRVRSDPYLREWSYVKPIFHAAARDPTEVWRRSDAGSFECVPDAGPDVYQLVVGTLNGTVLWQTSEPVASPLNADWIEVGVINHDDTGIFWECPDLFVLPGTTTWVSKHSLIGYGDFYQTGTFDGFSFTAQDGQYFEKQMYDTNPSFYASKSFYDAAKHRRVLWGWLKMNPWPSDDEADVGGWQNTQTVPRTITLAEDGVTLKTWPIEEIESLRKETGGFHGRNLTVAAGNELLIPLLGAMLDIEMNIQTTGDTLCGVRVLVDSEDPSSHVEVLTATSSLRVLVDASIVEAFFGHGPATTFFSSPKATSTGVSLVASGTSDAFCAFTVDVWEMCPFTFDVSLARESVTVGQWVLLA